MSAPRVTPLLCCFTRYTRDACVFVYCRRHAFAATSLICFFHVAYATCLLSYAAFAAMPLLRDAMLLRFADAASVFRRCHADMPPLSPCYASGAIISIVATAMLIDADAAACRRCLLIYAAAITLFRLRQIPPPLTTLLTMIFRRLLPLMLFRCCLRHACRCH